MSKETRAGSGDTIDSDTFVPTGKHLGMGCWGVVDEYKDPVGQSWAIKRFCPNDVAKQQMTERGWTEEDVMRAEGLPLDASKHHLVPRVVERDRNGKLYVGMPVYDGGRTLDDKMTSISSEDGVGGKRLRIGILRDIAAAVAYLHTRSYGTLWDTKRQTNTAHGDVKPANIFIVDDHAFLGDLGSSSCISIGGHGSKRGTHGDANYRAPECFSNDAKPSASADVWSLGAIAYKLDTGKGIYDDVDVANLSKEELAKILKQKVKKASRGIRPFLKKSLVVDEKERFYNGTPALSCLEKTLDGLSGWKSIRKHLGWAVPAAAAASIIAGLIYAESTYEPKRLTMPIITTNGVSSGLLYMNQNKPRGEIQFDAENITDLAQAPPARGMMTEAVNRYAKLSTDNRIVAYLTKAVQTAWWTKSSDVDPLTDEQQTLYNSCVKGDERARQNALCGPVYPVVSKSIEVALTKSVRLDGKVDLEDTLAIARLGDEVVNEAKRRSGSLDFAVYRFAKYTDGSNVIPPKERAFIELSLTYAEKDPDMILDSSQTDQLRRSSQVSNSK